MAIVKRTVKGSALTYQELDGNFTDLDTRITNYENSTAANIGTVDIDFGSNKILYANVYAQLGDLPSPSTYHGMFAHVHATGKAYYAHAGNWVELANASEVSGAGIALTDLSVTTASASGGGSLTYNNSSGVFTYTPPAIANYTDSDVDSHLNTSTAITNQILSWNGADYAWVTNSTDISSSNIGDLANVSSASASSGQVLKWDGSQWAPASDSISGGGGGITLADLSVTTNPAGSAALSYDNGTGTFTYTPPDLSSYITSVAFVDLTSTPTTLSGYGITDAPADLSDLTITGDTDFGANKILYANVYSNLVDLPSASTYHGMFAHVHATGKGYFAHAGAWVPLANESTVPTDLTDLGISDGTDGQVLSTDGAGNFSFVTIGGSGYSDSDVDTHLNTSSATSGEILSWNGSDYEWVADQTGSGSGISDVVDDTSPQLGGDLDVNGNSIQYTFSVSNNGASDYTFSDAGNHWFPSSENDPVLYLRRGETYVFDVNASGHPFQIRTSSGGSAYNTGVSNNGAQVGQVTFKVPMSAPNTLYYQCTIHSVMGNTINIV